MAEMFSKQSHIYANDGINQRRSVLLAQRVHDEMKSLWTNVILTDSAGVTRINPSEIIKHSDRALLKKPLVDVRSFML